MYLTWDYGPSGKDVTNLLPRRKLLVTRPATSTSVIQKSTDGGRHGGGSSTSAPGFPASGGDSAPLVLEPDGKIDVDYQGYHMTTRRS